MLEFGTFFLCVCVMSHITQTKGYPVSTQRQWVMVEVHFSTKKSEKLSESLKKHNTHYNIICVCVFDLFLSSSFDLEGCTIAR